MHLIKSADFAAPSSKHAYRKAHQVLKILEGQGAIVTTVERETRSGSREVAVDQRGLTPEPPAMTSSNPRRLDAAAVEQEARSDNQEVAVDRRGLTPEPPATASSNPRRLDTATVEQEVRSDSQEVAVDQRGLAPEPPATTSLNKRRLDVAMVNAPLSIVKRSRQMHLSTHGQKLAIDPPVSQLSAYLRLPFGRIKKMCGIKGKVPWFDLHSSAHPVPFIGAEHIGSTTFTSLYAQLGTQETSHPGHPEAKKIEPVVKLGFHHTVPTSFQRETAPSSGRARSVADVAKELYRRAPSAAQRYTGQGGAFLDKTIALLCRELLWASDVTTSVLPVRIHVDYHEPTRDAIQQYAILFTACGRQHLLPLSVMLCDSAGHAGDTTRAALVTSLVAGGWYVASPRANTANYRLSKSQLAMRAATQAARDKFERSPVLKCDDVRILGAGKRDEPWAPRRYSDVWYIYQDIASFDHFSRMASDELHRSPPYGREGYSSLPELVQRILSISMTVSWTGSSVPTRPFEHIALDIFDLHEQSFCPVPSDTALDLGDPDGEDDNEGLENDSDDERDQEEGKRGLSNSDLESLATLRELYSSDKTWIIDFEFINLIAMKSAVPFTVSIRTVQGQSILDAVIDYHGASLDDILFGQVSGSNTNEVTHMDLALQKSDAGSWS
ncbi:hypothetical protein B0A49_00800 [Cryomyces minteri]|uniref:Uncharacterized protein n=1 Tax=Cryomyces minteri TaxID=331657 RepID=A0A4V5NK62_9PEZI|nr:hypothetical protein B0A49_00800 [Cryomyces minteri]